METPTHPPSPPGDFVAFAREHARPQNRFLGCSRISDYEVLGKLGEGTFGEVHRAKSKKTGAVVALKKILMHNEKDGFPITALRENPGITLTEAQIKCYMLQLLEGLRYLHDNHILHRDMKAANLLINNKGV